MSGNGFIRTVIFMLVFGYIGLIIGFVIGGNPYALLYACTGAVIGLLAGILFS